MRILVFAPYAGIWRHTVMENQLIDVISNISDVEIIKIRCGGTFIHGCGVTRYLHVSENSQEHVREAACQKCMFAAEKSDSHQNIRAEYLRSFIQAADRETIMRKVESFDFSDPLSITKGDLQIGRIALYELILRFKKRNLELDNKQLRHFEVELENALLTQIAAERILNILKPDVVLAFNPQYTSAGVFTSLATSSGIKTYYVSGSGSPREIATAIRIWDWNKFKLVDPALESWTTRKRKGKIKGSSRKRAIAHFEYLCSADSPWTYSTRSLSKSPYEAFKIPKNNRIVLAVLNSLDEILASSVLESVPATRYKSMVFENQQTWVKYLINHYKESEDTTLIIRLHPREFPNKRESALAEQAEVWEEIFSNLPSNVVINHPRDEFSIYDFFDDVALVTTGWSSVSLEALFRSIPVVTYDRNLLGFPGELVFTGESKDEYSFNLDFAMKHGRDAVFRESVLEWIDFAFGVGSARLGGGIQDFHLRYVNRTVNGLLHFLRRLVLRLCPIDEKKMDLSVFRMRNDDKKIINLISHRRDSFFDV